MKTIGCVLMVATMAMMTSNGRCAEAASTTAPPATAQAATNAPSPAAPASDALMPIPLVFPKAMFTGTPSSMKGARLDPAATKRAKRDRVLAPAGAKNLAAGKDVTSSDKEPVIGDLTLVTDGDKDGKEGSYVELGPNTQWVQIDLGKPCNIYGVVMWHYHSMARVYHDVVVQIADDADFIENVRTVFNTDDDNSSGLGKGDAFEYVETNEGYLIQMKGEKARYVRLYSNGSTSGSQNHYTEVEVFGVEGK